MTDLRKAAERLVAAVENDDNIMMAMDELRQALAQSKQEPVAWILNRELFWHSEYQSIAEPNDGASPLYIAPPKREWVGLTGDEQETIERMANDSLDAICLTEAKLKEKNT